MNLRRIAVALGAAITIAHVALAVAACSGGCAGAQLPTTPREQARAAVLVLAEGVRLADQSCAAVALERSDAPLADRCADAYGVARSSLLAAAGGVDAWDSGRQGEVRCATAQGATAARELAAAIATAGGEVPPTLTDGLELYAELAGASCTQPTTDDAGDAS